jgi:hypothetical protein
VFVQSFPEHGGKWQISTAGGLDPHWRADGKEMFFLSADQRMMSVTIRAVAGFEADVPRPIFSARTMSPGLGPHTHYAVSADGQRFLIAAPLAGVSLAGNTVVLHWVAEARQR